MTNVLDIVLGISLPLKLAWILWAAGVAGQVVWYRRARVVVLPRMQPTPKPARKPAPDVTEAAPV